jgi:hypothetical protein
MVSDGVERKRVTAKTAVEVVTATWGSSAGAVLRLAIATDIDPSVLRVLDFIQHQPVADWNASWQPRAAHFADMLMDTTVSRDSAIGAAIDAALHEGSMSASDLRAAGLIDAVPSSANKNFDLVISDCDGVLVDSEVL